MSVSVLVRIERKTQNGRVLLRRNIIVEGKITKTHGKYSILNKLKLKQLK